MKREILSFIVGFLLSVALTVAVYLVAVSHLLSGNLFIVVVLVLAVAQLIVQLVFFLHLGREENPHWKLGFFIATIGLILVIVVGSIWIMTHLNYNMTPQQINTYLENQQGF